MTTDTLLAGITAHSVQTSVLRVNVLERSVQNPVATVVFVHGNVSSALFWQPTMLSLPEKVRAIALDLRGFGDTETVPVDATRGLRDFSDDLAAVVQQLGLQHPHLVGWSMGAGVVLQYVLDQPGSAASVTLVAPVSPYGFGGTAGVDGRLLTSDAAGTGGGAANPDFISRLAAGDKTEEAQTSPRTVYQTAYVKPPFVSDRDDLWVHSMLSTATGPENYPGTSESSANWPGFAPGKTGVLNTMSPAYLNLSSLVNVASKPNILWIRGADDVIVSDTSFFDLNYLGQLGVVPGWPGEESAPAQPMVSQTRAVLESYQAAGGHYREEVFAECGHSPQIEYPEKFVQQLTEHIVANS